MVVVRISFILPGVAREPSGGYIVVYEYADRLAARGHEVHIIHSLTLPFTENSRKPLWLRYFGNRLLHRCTSPWFQFRHRVKQSVAPQIAENYVPESDAIIATWWATSYGVKQLRYTESSKYYLIQHYETWAAGEELINRSFALGLKNIVITGWLADILNDLGSDVYACVPNGIDLTKFAITIPIGERSDYSVAMMYHGAEWKGAADGMAAITMVKEKIGNLAVRIFSAYPKPQWMPEWVEYFCKPTAEQLVGIYNSSAVFVSPSWTEGFGLPGAEALACGCALATTDSGGVREYAKHGETALLSPPKAPRYLADNILCLLNEKELRHDIARRGHRYMQHFSWDLAVDRMESTLRPAMA